MTIDEQIEILDAYKRGEEIEWKNSGDELFKYSVSKEVGGENYCFDFINCVYRIKPKWWRAKREKIYYYIDQYGYAAAERDFFSLGDNICYKFGNYFRTSEEAQKASDLIKELLTKFHENNK